MTPDMVPSLTDPTQRPNEPLTAGLPSGPGPGPSQPPVQQQWSTARDIIANAAMSPTASPALQMMAHRIQSGF